MEERVCDDALRVGSLGVSSFEVDLDNDSQSKCGHPRVTLSHGRQTVGTPHRCTEGAADLSLSPRLLQNSLQQQPPCPPDAPQHHRQRLFR